MFDSCNSASGTRGDDDNSLTLVRTVKLEDVPFRKETDREIRESLSRSAHPDEAHSRRGLKSHMLISACKSSEDAIESDGRGKLSTVLLKLLYNTSPNKLRYRDILANIDPIPPLVYFCHRSKTVSIIFFLDRILNVKVIPKIGSSLMAKFSSLGRFTPSDLRRTL